MTYPVRAYASALRDACGDLEEFRRLVRDLRSVAHGATASAEVRAFVADPRIPVAEQARVLVAGCSSFDARVQRVVRELALHRHLELLSGVADAADRLADAEEGRSQVVVESAVEVPNTLRVRLHATLERRLGRGITAVYATHPELLGGIRVTIDGARCWDGTIAGRLERLRTRIRDVV